MSNICSITFFWITCGHCVVDTIHNQHDVGHFLSDHNSFLVNAGGVVVGPIFSIVISASEVFELQLANSPPFVPSRSVITGSNEITRTRRALENK